MNKDKYGDIDTPITERFDVVLDENTAPGNGINFRTLMNKKILCKNANRLDTQLLRMVISLIHEEEASVLLIIDSNDMDGLKNDNTDFIMSNTIMEKYKLL